MSERKYSTMLTVFIPRSLLGDPISISFFLVPSCLLTSLSLSFFLPTYLYFLNILLGMCIICIIFSNGWEKDKNFKKERKKTETLKCPSMRQLWYKKSRDPVWRRVWAHWLSFLSFQFLTVKCITHSISILSTAHVIKYNSEQAWHNSLPSWSLQSIRNDTYFKK